MNMDDDKNLRYDGPLPQNRATHISEHFINRLRKMLCDQRHITPHFDACLAFKQLEEYVAQMLRFRHDGRT